MVVESLDKQQRTHRGQRQPEVCGLVFHLDLNLMEESLDSFLLKAFPVNREEDKRLVYLTVKIFSVPSCWLIYQESLNPVEPVISLSNNLTLL